MRAIIISNGNFNINTLKKIKKSSDLIVCADGGANHLYKTEIVPDIIIGDLDSLNEDSIKYYKNLNISFNKFPSKKDKTDTELAVEFALENKAEEIILLGSTGTRLDHTLGNISILYKLLKRNIKASIVDENNEIYIMNKSIKIKKEENTFVSFLPIFKDCSGVTMKGFKYPTDNLDFELGSTMGISNEVEDSEGTIKINNGVALVIKSRDS